MSAPPLDTLQTLSAGPETFQKQDQTTVYNRFSLGSETFRAVSDSLGTLREQRQTTGNDSKIIKIMKRIETGLRWLEMS